MPVIRYHFHIDENLAGPAATDIDIFSGGDDGDCGYRFQKGAQYVVFTQQENDGQLYSTICNGTRPASEGRAVMPQLRAMRDGKTFASVFGVLHRADPPFLGPPDPPADASADDPPGVTADADDSLPHVAIKLQSGDDRFQTSTDAHGVYSIYDVHAGEYSFTANLPPQMQLSQKSTPGELPPFTIPNGACYEYDVEALPTGHIQGSVLGPDGKPLPIASVELFRVGHYDDSRPGLWGFQGAKGVFDFDHVGPGQYVLVFNRTDKRDPNSPFPRAFYPGVGEISAAKPIVLKDGQDLAGVNMKLANQYDSSRVARALEVDRRQASGRRHGLGESQPGKQSFRRENWRKSLSIYAARVRHLHHFRVGRSASAARSRSPRSSRVRGSPSNRNSRGFSEWLRYGRKRNYSDVRPPRMRQVSRPTR